MFSDLEKQAEDYAREKDSKSPGVASIAVRLVEEVSSPTFILPLKQEALTSDGTTTYLYESNSTYPALFAFIAEVLHTKVPIEIGSAKFGPGEIIVKSASKADADRELAKSLHELRQLIHAKKPEISSKYTTAS